LLPNVIPDIKIVTITTTAGAQDQSNAVIKVENGEIIEGIF